MAGDATVNFHQYQLEQAPVRVDMIVGGLWLNRAELLRLEEHVIDGLRFELRGFMLRDQLADKTVEHSWHMTRQWGSWWQHTKFVHFPTISRWLRRPPRMTEDKRTVMVNLKTYATFPEAKIPYPADLGPVRIHQIPTITTVRGWPDDV